MGSTGNPRFHEIKVTWRTGGATGPVVGTGRNLDLKALNLPAGTTVFAEVRDPIGPAARTGCDPSTNNARGRTRLQRLALRAERTWTVGDAVTPTAADAGRQPSTYDTRPVAGRRGRLRRHQPSRPSRPAGDVDAQRHLVADPGTPQLTSAR